MDENFSHSYLNKRVARLLETPVTAARDDDSFSKHNIHSSEKSYISIIPLPNL